MTGLQPYPMLTKNPPAFPQHFTSERGMNLRDYFATAAMQAIVMKFGELDKVDDFVAAAYEIADAMLEAREE